VARCGTHFVHVPFSKIFFEKHLSIDQIYRLFLLVISLQNKKKYKKIQFFNNFIGKRKHPIGGQILRPSYIATQNDREKIDREESLQDFHKKCTFNLFLFEVLFDVSNLNEKVVTVKFTCAEFVLY
jgi:hypothetical protein